MRTRASFRLHGDDARLTAAAVSRTLGLEPTRAGEAGDHVGRRSTARRAESLWLLEIDRVLMQRLLALPGELWLDVCGDGADED